MFRVSDFEGHPPLSYTAFSPRISQQTWAGLSRPSGSYVQPPVQTRLHSLFT